MEKKIPKNKKYQMHDSLSVINEPQVEYGLQYEIDLFSEERLYSHDEVFKEFAKRLNHKIGTNIPL